MSLRLLPHLRRDWCLCLGEQRYMFLSFIPSLTRPCTCVHKPARHMYLTTVRVCVMWVSARVRAYLSIARTRSYCACPSSLRHSGLNTFPFPTTGHNHTVRLVPKLRACQQVQVKIHREAGPPQTAPHVQNNYVSGHRNPISRRLAVAFQHHLHADW